MFNSLHTSSLSRSSKNSQRKRSFSFCGRAASARCTLHPILRRDHPGFHRRPRFVDRVELFRHRLVARAGPINLEQHVVAHPVDERPEVFGGLQAAPLLERRQHAPERLLPRVFYLSWRPQPRSELDGEQVAEVPGEMLLGLGDPRPPGARRKPGRSRIGPVASPKSVLHSDSDGRGPDVSCQGRAVTDRRCPALVIEPPWWRRPNVGPYEL